MPLAYGVTMANDDDDARLYRWTIRSLYLAALVANAWLLWDQVKDTPEAQVAISKVKARADKIAAPLTNRQWFRRQANAVIYEAVTVLEEAGDA